MVKKLRAVPGPEGQKLLEMRQQYVARGVANTTPVFVARAKGAVIVDVDGNEYLDFAAGIGTINVGHCPEEVVMAIKEQAERYIHPCFHVAMYEPYVKLAAKLASITPGDYAKKVMLANSGAEAVENAVKIARKYTGRPGILAFECAFHGRTLMAMTLTSKVKPYKYGFGPFAPEVYKVPSAYCYRCYFGQQYPACDLMCVKNIKRFFVAECPADRFAAMIIEPVQGEGGFIVPPPEFLPALQELCREHGMLFIVDEVQTGFGRTGRLFASMHYHLEPDLITLAKSLAAGVPLSGVVGRAEIMDAPAPGEIGGTYGGNPLACTAALQAIEIIERERLAERALAIGKVMMERLKAMQEKFPLIGDVRGQGAMVAMELVKDRRTKEPASEVVPQIVAAAYRRGLILLGAGIYSNVIRFLPPLVVSDSELNAGLDILEEAMDEVLAK